MDHAAFRPPEEAAVVSGGGGHLKAFVTASVSFNSRRRSVENGAKEGSMSTSETSLVVMLSRTSLEPNPEDRSSDDSDVQDARQGAGAAGHAGRALRFQAPPAAGRPCEARADWFDFPETA
eukprot:2463953-Rhodomonas_salina.1